MNLEQFKMTYAAFKDADKIQVICDHPQHEPRGEIITIGKQPARRNIIKNNNAAFICRQCIMLHDNPVHKSGQGRRQTDEIIKVHCPEPRHKGDSWREMKKSCYFGKLAEPYEQICGSCVQLDKEIPEEQKAKISETLSGRKLSHEHKEKIKNYMDAHPEIYRRPENLRPELGRGWNKGLETPKEVREKISIANIGQSRTPQQCENISEGRKKMLEETGGFTKEHRENISKATIRQYRKGFDPKLHHLKGWHESPKAGKVFYRSSYEKRAFMLLDEDDAVITYKVEAVEVLYYHPKKEINSTYLIDLHVFYKDGTEKWVEIKPERWLKDVVIIAKIEAAQGKSVIEKVPFEVWTEMKLFGAVYNEKNMRNFVKKIKEGIV